MEQLERLVTQDEAAELFDGECLVHDGCRYIGPALAYGDRACRDRGISTGSISER